MKFKVLFAIVGVAALSAVSLGQGFRGGFGGMAAGGAAANPSFLVNRDDVKKDLNITDDQKAKLDEIRQGMRDRFTEAFQSAGGGGGQPDREAMQKVMAGVMAKIAEDVNKVLTADQQKRLKEISIQLSGNQAAAVPDVQKDLGLSDDQKAKIADLGKRQQTANTELFAKVQSGDVQREDVAGIMEKNTKVMNDEIGKVLTQAQKDKLAEMGGKKFTATDQPRGFGGGGGGR